MSFWDSMRTAVDRVIGTSATVTVAMDPRVVVPGQSVSVEIAVKNGPSNLDARAVLFEIESVEDINLPRSANIANVFADAAAAASKRPGPSEPEATLHTEVLVKSKITVSAGLRLNPGEDRKFKGTFRLPMSVQPTYEGKYARHSWRLRARLDILGTDPSSEWLTFRVRLPE